MSQTAYPEQYQQQQNWGPQGGYQQNYPQQNEQQNWQNNNYQQQNNYQQNDYKQQPQQMAYPPTQNAYNQQASSISGAVDASFNVLCNFPFVQIKQGVENVEVLTGFESSNKYAVLDPNGNCLMKCNEKSSTLAKLALGSGRSMDIRITDASGANQLMTITRPFKLWHKDVTIMDQSGRQIGSVLKKFAIGKTIFHVSNGQDQQLFTIRGGAFINLGKSRKFTITNSQGTEVGYIQKEWAGLLKEAFTDADHFSIHFPAGTSGETRALLIATTLFIDLSHFEK